MSQFSIHLTNISTTSVLSCDRQNVGVNIAVMGITHVFEDVLDTTLRPKADMHEGNLPNQQGKVFIVTDGNSGSGAELIKIL